MSAGSDLPEFGAQHRVQAFSHLLRILAGKPPECDPDTAFLAGMVIGLGVAMLQRQHGMTKEAARAAFGRRIGEMSALWASLAAMDAADLEPGTDGEADQIAL